jgi:hypothetical protein
MTKKICRLCGSHDDMHRGLCGRCRSVEHEEAERLHHGPTVEPPHDRPWVARSAFVGRKRRSPRQ